MKIAKSQKCPCWSGKSYADCCQKYHRGVLAENALALMRSRYAAYALGLSAYIIETTHPRSPHRVPDEKRWKQEIELYSSHISYNGLEIIETSFGEVESFVTFFAMLAKDHTDLSFTERSRFLKEGQAWLYIDGKITRGRQ